MAERAVAAGGALRRDEPFGLEEADLGDGDVREVRTQDGEDVADPHQPAGRERGHDPSPPVDDCATPGSACPPLTWTISPHLAQLAPDLLEWYYAQSHWTGTDYFALPPTRWKV